MVQDESRNGRLLAWGVCAVLAAIPLIILIPLIARYGFRAPFWDEWFLVPTIDRLFSGQLTFTDLWSQHNEHRPLFPRLVMLGLARMTHWDLRWNLVCNVLLGLTWLGGTLGLVWNTARRASKPVAPWIVPVMAFVILSWAQMENWIWGWQLLVFMNSTAVAVGVFLLAGNPWRWTRFAGALAAGVVATYTMASGLLFWIALFPLTLTDTRLPKPQRILAALLWMLMAILTFQSYLFRYFKPTVSPPLDAFIRNPFGFLQFAVLYLGGPLTGLLTAPAWHGVAPAVPPYAFIPGLAGLALAAAMLTYYVKKRPIPLHALAPWICMALYAGGAAVLTAVGRIGLGVQNALISQYMTTGAIFWAASAGAAMTLRPYPLHLPRFRRAALGVVGIALFLAGELLMLRQSRDWTHLCRWRRMSWEAVRQGHHAPFYFKDLCYDPDLMPKVYLPAVHRLSLCGINAPPSPDYDAAAYLREAKEFLRRRTVPPARTYLETALFLEPANDEARQLLAQLPP
ncbi:MAG TPA: hypothetical protein HPP83_10015 [Candidatus Hydrogenedentes bacterium]|nr:hypothetical protein [Candidatus Hydrogenedentota bacterium]